MSDLLVILGAGASYDALREGEERPPLANDLFNEQYDDLQQEFPRVDLLRDTILARMKQGQSLEQILGRLAESPDPNIQRQVFEIPLYLQRLLARFSGMRPGTYDSLITLIQEAQVSVTFVTLNYDTILDEAIGRTYDDSLIASLDDYVDPSSTRKWNYVKLHGSVNWGFKTTVAAPGRLLGGTQSQLHAHYRPSMAQVYETGHDRSGVHLLDSRDTYLLEDRMTYPALAMPTDWNKQTLCPEAHLEALRSALRSNPSILVIGNQGLDTDLMDILRNTEPAQAPQHLGDFIRDVFGSRRPVHVVDPSDVLDVASRFAEALGRPDFTFSQEDIGFRDFVESEEAGRFFDDVKAASHRA